MSRPSVSDMLDTLDTAAPRLAVLERYYAGEQDLAYLSPEARIAVGKRLDRLAVNVPRLVVSALAERLRVAGFDLDGTRSEALWSAWLGTDLDQLAGQAHREALALGSAFALVWADDRGRPRVSIESPHSMAVARHPATGEVTGAVKRWTEPTTDGRATQTHVVAYRPAEIVHLIGRPGSSSTLEAVRSVENPLGVVPVVPLINTDRPGRLDGVSEFLDVIPLVDGLNKSLADLLVTSEYYARPRRWATGLELTETDVLDVDGNPTGETVAVNPIPESDRVMISEDPNTKFGQLDGASLSGYRTVVDIFVQQISAVTGLPGHYLGVSHANPTSAEQTRAAEAALIVKAEARQATFGRAWEQVGRLMLAVTTGLDPEDHDVRVRWEDPAARSVAAEADATMKLHSEQIITTDEARDTVGVN
ncbi:MAG: phage portal protein [Actinomycetia bacterium]|nr:phage portal protein [Actinomycetes bacterium]